MTLRPTGPALQRHQDEIAVAPRGARRRNLGAGVRHGQARGGARVSARGGPLLGLTLLLALGRPAAGLDPPWQERPDWGAAFTERGVAGTLVVVDERDGSHGVHDAARAAVHYVPASTFKLPHALFALDAGVVRDEFQVFPWDGVERPVAAWNQDQDLRASLRNSAVWVYQGFARQLGAARERDYLGRIGYGNADPGDDLEHFWLTGPLAISAFEQVQFLQRLYRNQLPFRVEHQRLLKDLMVVEAGRTWILRAKTGWGAGDGADLGWWVGWVEWPAGPVFFALNLDMPGGGADAPKRETIAHAVLESIAALPTPP